MKNKIKKIFKKVSDIKEPVSRFLSVAQSTLGVLTILTNNKGLHYGAITTSAAKGLVDLIPNPKVQNTIHSMGFVNSIIVRRVLTCSELLDPVIKHKVLTKQIINLTENDQNEASRKLYFDKEKNILIYEDFSCHYSSRLSIWTNISDSEKHINVCKKYIYDELSSYYKDSSYYLCSENLDAWTRCWYLKEYNLNVSNVKCSGILDQYVNDLKKYINVGLNRSIILNGEPGIGKSFSIKYIADKLNMRVLKLPGNYFSNIESIIDLIKCLNIEILIIDDFDRVECIDSYLEQIESLRTSVKLLLVSVNHLDKMPPASKRPGRFDQIIDFNNMLNKNEFIVDVVDQLDSEFRERLLKLSVAGICEFINRKNVIGLDKAIETFGDLENR